MHGGKAQRLRRGVRRDVGRRAPDDSHGLRTVLEGLLAGAFVSGTAGGKVNTALARRRHHRQFQAGFLADSRDRGRWSRSGRVGVAATEPPPETTRLRLSLSHVPTICLAPQYAELHGGTIRVESEPGQGSTFAFILLQRSLEAI